MAFAKLFGGSENNEAEAQDKRRADVAAEFDRLARTAELAVLAAKAEWAAKTLKEWEDDKARYRFDCKKFGNFLTLFITRAANPDDNDRTPRKFSTSINLGLVRDIKLKVGHAPDENGQVGYSSRAVEDGTGKWLMSPYYPDAFKNTKYHQEVAPAYPYVPSGRPVYYLQPPPSQQGNGGIGYHQESAPPQFKTVNFPRFAEDDSILFSGLNATVYVPAGMGQQVHDRLMKEIGAPND